MRMIGETPLRRRADQHERFDTWIREHGKAVRGYLMAMVRRADVADDLAQEVFCRAWQARARYREQGNARAYLLRIADRLVCDHRRRAGRELTLDKETWKQIEPVSRSLSPNLFLRDAGLLQVRNVRGQEYLDLGASAAFAMVDHQVAHVFVNDRNRLNEVAKALRETDGIADVINRRRQPNFRVKHPNAGELIAVAEPRFWFSYHYWVDIHSKLGYDPLELFFNKNTMSIETSNHTLVRGSHGRLPEDPLDGGVLITTAPVLKKTESESVEAVKVPEIISRIVV